MTDRTGFLGDTSPGTVGHGAEEPVPWKEICRVEERMRFVLAVSESDETFSALCARFGISRKTGYKWVERYEELGVEGLNEGRPVARSCPHRMPSELLHQVVELRKEHPTWGPKKLRARLQDVGVAGVPAASTIGDALKKHGLVRPRRRRVGVPMTVTPLAETLHPNDTWCVDFKGHFMLGDKTRCHPLTMTDHVSRYLLKCEAVEKPDFVHVQPHFERAFREFGLPWRIRSDNGPPFATAGLGGLSELSVWWIRLGIEPERIEPGEPQQNGRHERMHRTLQEETASPPSLTRLGQQRAFDCFRRVYNQERPHESLKMKPPASVFVPSRRHMPEKPKSPEYPDTMAVKKLDDKGRLQIHRGKLFRVKLSKLLAREPIGMKPLDEDHWELFYGPVLIAELKIRSKEFRLEKRR